MALPGEDMDALLDRIVLATPLGIRFWDPVQDLPVTDHLDVIARRAGAEARAVRGVRARSGVFVFHGLPGFPNPVLPATGGPAANAAEFLVDVSDRRGRFHAMRFRAQAPYRGVWRPELSGSPPAAAPGAFLLSTPSRTAPAGTARVRADLWDRVHARPASFAVLEVRIQGRPWYGMADRFGRAAVLFPYPRPELLAGSPPPPQPITGAAWEIEIAAFYDPALGEGVAADDPPEQEDIRNQPAVRLDPGSPASPPVPVTLLPGTISASLEYGRDLVLRSGDEPRLILVPETTSP